MKQITIQTPQQTTQTRAEEAIKNTLETMKTEGLAQNLRHAQVLRVKLRKIAKETDLFNPMKVKTFISTLKVNGGTKNGFEYIYQKFCEANQLPPFDLTFYKYKPPIPLIPTPENVNIILNSLSERFYTPIAIMAETGVEGEELTKTNRKNIDTQTGNISIIGVKDHDNGTYQLNPQLTENLRQYLAKHQEEYPFPTSRQLGDAWRTCRQKRAKELHKPELLKIPIKNLRNYAGAIFYLTKGKDPIQTMLFLRHKKLETTLKYLKGLKTFTSKAQYTTKTVKLGQPDTIEKITELSNSGFEKYNEADGYQFFRILQY